MDTKAARSFDEEAGRLMERAQKYIEQSKVENDLKMKRQYEELAAELMTQAEIMFAKAQSFLAKT